MRNKAMNALIEMGVPARNKGFKYITEIMCLFDEDESWFYMKTMALYEKIAKMNGDTASRVERAIRHAFSIALEKGCLDVVEKYLTLQHPTNSNLLATFYIRLSQEGKDAD